MKPQAIENFPYIKLAVESPALVQQCSGLKHIDGWCLRIWDFLNLACKNLSAFSAWNHSSKSITR